MQTQNKNIKLTIATIAIIVLSLYANPAYAQGRGCRTDGIGTYSGWWSNTNVPQQYQLSDAQIKGLNDIRSQYDDKIIPLQKELRTLRIEAEGYAARSDVDSRKTKSYRKDIRNLEDQIGDLRVDAKAGINKILTKEQLPYYADRCDWWNMDDGMMGDMGYGMGTYGNHNMMSGRWGCW